MERSFERDFRALGEIFDFADRFADAHGLNHSLKHSVNLIVEELFTNMVRHNIGGGASIRIGLKAEDGRLRIVLVDENVDPWDPSQVPVVPVDRPIEERRPGGLGLHLVRALADQIEYDYKDRRMKVTVIKNLER
jgi:anti-sigma regulatory factor (Ser/Thr protein kinase)